MLKMEENIGRLQGVSMSDYIIIAIDTEHVGLGSEEKVKVFLGIAVNMIMVQKREKRQPLIKR